MKAINLNLDISVACENLYEALKENTDSGAFEELSTIELMEIQNHINKMLIDRFKPLQKGVASLIQLEAQAFNDRTT